MTRATLFLSYKTLNIDKNTYFITLIEDEYTLALPLDIQWHRKWGSDLEYLILGVSLDGYHIINAWPVYVRSVNLKSHRQLSVSLLGGI